MGWTWLHTMGDAYTIPLPAIFPKRAFSFTQLEMSPYSLGSSCFLPTPGCFPPVPPRSVFPSEVPQLVAFGAWGRQSHHSAQVFGHQPYRDHHNQRNTHTHNTKHECTGIMRTKRRRKKIKENSEQSFCQTKGQIRDQTLSDQRVEQWPNSAR